MQKNVAWRRNGIMMAMNLAKGVQFLGPWFAEQSVPSFGAEAHHAREAAVEIPKTDRPHKAWQVVAHSADGVQAILSVIDDCDEKNRRTGEFRSNSLTLDAHHKSFPARVTLNFVDF